MDGSVLLQLGIAGAALFVLYQLAKLALHTWGKNDAARTIAIADGFKSITDSHAQMVRDNANGYMATTEMLNEHHAKVAGQIGNVRDLMIAIDSKVSTALDLTPIRTQRPELIQPIDKTLLSSTTNPPPFNTQPPFENSDLEDTPVQVPIPQPIPKRAQTAQPMTVQIPPAERAGTPTGRAQAVPRPVSGEYSGATKKPR